MASDHHPFLAELRAAWADGRTVFSITAITHRALSVVTSATSFLWQHL